MAAQIPAGYTILDVELLQGFLRRAGHCVLWDGVYGPETQRAAEAAGVITLADAEYHTKAWAEADGLARLKAVAATREDRCPEIPVRESPYRPAPTAASSLQPTPVTPNLAWLWWALGGLALLAGGGVAVWAFSRRGRRRRRR